MIKWTTNNNNTHYNKSSWEFFYLIPIEVPTAKSARGLIGKVAEKGFLGWRYQGLFNRLRAFRRARVIGCPWCVAWSRGSVIVNMDRKRPPKKRAFFGWTERIKNLSQIDLNIRPKSTPKSVQNRTTNRWEVCLKISFGASVRTQGRFQGRSPLRSASLRLLDVFLVENVAPRVDFGTQLKSRNGLQNHALFDTVCSSPLLKNFWRKKYVFGKRK